MDCIARVFFPFPAQIELTLMIYLALMIVGAVWWSGSWLWGLAVVLCATLAWMIDRWML